MGESAADTTIGSVSASASTPGAPSADPWFVSSPLADGVWLLSEPGHVFCFLVEGSERAVLIDSGTGLGDTAAAARALTDRPIVVVNTHSHDDHRGGNAGFTEVAAHPVAVARMTNPVPAERVAAYLDVTAAQVAAYQAALALDDRFFHFFTAANRPRPLSGDRAGPLARDGIAAGPVADPLLDGQRVDLGGRMLTVAHTPGHSPDSICLFDERDGLLFVGDSLITGDFWAHTDDTDLAAFTTSLRRLDAELGPAVRRVFPAHTRAWEVPPSFLRAAADALEEVRTGRNVGVPGEDLYGRPVSRHRFAEFNILRPAVRSGTEHQDNQRC